MRLITVGCSQTYGHALPDCYVEDSRTDDGLGVAEQPSKMAFPQLIGDYLELEVCNLSWPGGSTKNMWYELVHFDYKPTDKVLCVWTFANRSMIVKRGKKMHLGIWPSLVPMNKAYQKFVATSNSDEDLELQSYQYMDHAHKVVAPQVESILHYKLSKVQYETMPNWCEFKFQNALDCIVPPDTMDLALDDRHYGINSHKSIARQMIQDLTIDAN